MSCVIYPPPKSEEHSLRASKFSKRTLAFKRDAEDETPASKRFSFVQTLDTNTKSKRRLFEVL